MGITVLVANRFNSMPADDRASQWLVWIKPVYRYTFLFPAYDEGLNIINCKS